MINNIFYLSLLLIFYVYVGYPLIAGFLGFIINRRVRKGPFEPSVTIIIAAYNEEAAIAATIENKYSLDYPQEKLEIIVISDDSTDRTDAIVNSYADHRLRLLRQTPRAGKTSALNMAVPLAKGEIIVFSDANSIYAPDALRKLLANFADEEVGYVTGKMMYLNPEGTPIGEGCSAYMKYENYLRDRETLLGSVVGVDGGIDAVRKTLYQPMKADQLPDFVLPLKVIEQGYRAVYEPEAILRESSLKDTGDEYRMRVRVSLRALWALLDMRHLLSLRSNPVFAWQLWSHKLLRYLCFLFFLITYISNGMLWNEGVLFKFVFVLQNLGYLAAMAMPFLGKIGLSGRGLVLSRYFVLLNLAAAHAFGKFLQGEKQILWTPRKG